LKGACLTTTTAAVLKISFGNDTAGTNLALCAGTIADFVSSHCALQLSDSGGPGFTFLTIVDTPAIAGKVIFVLREVGMYVAAAGGRGAECVGNCVYFLRRKIIC
jgi:hypothetical protein